MKRESESFLQLMLADEEAMHFYWFLCYSLLGWQFKMFVDLMMLAWAFLNTCEWFEYLLQHYPSIPILPLLANLIEMT